MGDVGVLMKKDENLRYTLTMTEEQARVVSRACELYARLLYGQLDELNHELLLRESREDICARRELANDFLMMLKQIYFPGLHGPGHSYGIGHDVVSDRAWAAYQAIRYTMAWHDHPEGGIGVHFDPPFSYGDEPLPVCQSIDEGSDMRGDQRS